MRAFTHGLKSIKSIVTKNDFGQLGRDVFHSNEPSPVLFKAIAGSCGLYHTLLVDENGTMLSFGKGGGGRLGNGTEEDVYFPHPSFQLDPPNLRSISAGSMHNAIVTADGEIFSWGYDSHGQAGCMGAGPMQDEDHKVLRPKPVLLDAKVDFVQVSCGAFHTLANDAAGNVYSWGRTDNGRCGAIPARSLNDINPFEYDDAEAPIWQPLLLEHITDICGVSAGGFFSMLLSNTRTELFSFGGNENGELGNGKRGKFEVEPQLVALELNFETGEHVDTVACGGFHTSVLTSHGRVLVFGSNQANQLGLGDKVTFCEKPVDLKLKDRVMQIACGPKYTLLATERNEIWMIGAGLAKPEFVYASFSAPIKLPVQQGLHHLLFFEADSNGAR